MCPNECPGLYDSYGPEFEALYTQYEQEGKGRKTIMARELWLKVLEAQIETGTPYMLYKDAANIKSNQKNREPFARPISAQRSWNTVRQTK